MTEEPKSDTPVGTPEGYTREEPTVSELGEPGTPGAGMTASAPHAADADLVEDGDRPAAPAPAPAPVIVTTSGGSGVAHGDAARDGDAHAFEAADDHGHGETRLGPIDVAGWAWAVVGGLAGIVVLAFFYLAIT
jgi:hypothetical protein